MTPRLASSVLTLVDYCRDVYHATVDDWKRLPPQWRGFVLMHAHRGHDMPTVLGRMDRGEINSNYDPQATFDTFLGQAPN